MSTKSGLQKEKEKEKERKVVEYAIEDYLEVKASLVREKTGPLKEFLFSRSLKDWEVSTVEGFHLDQQLVLIRETDPETLEHLVFLNPEDGSIRVKKLST